MHALPPVPPENLPAAARERAQQRLAEFLALVTDPPPAIPGAAMVFLCSDYVTQITQRHPEYLLDALDAHGSMPARTDRDLGADLAGRLEQAGDESELKACLRELRHRELIRIAWRDLLGQADLDEAMHDLSRLADVLVQGALGWLDARHREKYGIPRDREGEPQSLIVLGMGKLGGRELNFSSDIDLIFAYHRPGSTDGERTIDNQEYFQRLGRALIAALADVTPEGFCYRVDMRLRPFGSSGPLVMHFDAMEDYYQAHGREWERYALIKARVMAGDPADGERLMQKLRPFIYRRYLDYGAFANLRELKRKINEESVRKERIEDVKHGEGGIREVEFIGQVFQLIRGGRDRALQRRDLLGVLDLLARQQQLPRHAVDQLVHAYRFLRRVENRLQMQNDQQTHRLPPQAFDRTRLALAMGYPDEASFEMALVREQRRVHAQFEQVFSAPQRDDEDNLDDMPGAGRQRSLSRIWSLHTKQPEAEPLLARMGFADPPAAFEAIRALRQSPVTRSLSETGRQRLDRLMPLLLGAIVELDRPDPVLPRALQLVKTIARRSVYLSLLVENPLALSQLVKLCEASSWISDQLTRYPVLLDELLDPRALYAPPDREGLRWELDEELAQFPLEDQEQVLDRLRQYKQVQTLRVAAADIMGYLPLMRVSDHLTWLAEILLAKVLELSWNLMVQRHGEPWCGTGDRRRRARFAIIGYGKLGGLELGYGSDLDLVFLHDSDGDAAQTAGPRVIDNTEFFGRLGTRIVHLLGVFTPAGRLYEVDTRLRPSGLAGLLVSSLDAFARYQEGSAWTWEHQALVRTRCVAGDRELGERFAEVRRRILSRPRDRDALRAEVVEMRSKMLAEHASRDPDAFDLKRDRGGITDIEFMVQYWVLANAHEHPEVCTWPDKVRTLEVLGKVGVITPELGTALADAYRDMRNRIHRLTLAGAGTRVVDPPADLRALRSQVMATWDELFGDVTARAPAPEDTD
ncbi:Glutamate-ammonia-ligase adenylyltransferase [Thioalkalivibrio nitratireducens DSM 14787]|uniref:Bifunctional glutamine synthetase adenylyltransferase/adenylyl-removing enzyme n=1 Tax=Thioalkalivibrio nitratireducens (strain DSM 14787 / UNIQEM 213 / ALEN2) TaxID=1255043 RepID=L0DRI8_THIND|nr:bifunctional [glutamate--ammonia ligase]-adenylyl-L-tyrosine phosphorylase/[glutamate--ammonia-ligase] adenylyltransferase [Thioalkalivibrio nitratireducens]AGA32204.1 Glutamate-ammonia-ligase adenylyltransferase [Thioalkalivibrio nitratireducens DSM 14787]